MFLDAGGVPWWGFLMMPFMMLGMALMMWLMMRMMMGMDHGSGHGTHPSEGPSGEQRTDSDVESLRRQVVDLQNRLAGIESSSVEQHQDPGEPTVAPGEAEAATRERGDPA